MSVKRLEVTRDTQQGRAAPALKGDTHCTRGREDRLLPGPTGAVPEARKDPAGQRLPFKDLTLDAEAPATGAPRAHRASRRSTGPKHVVSDSAFRSRDSGLTGTHEAPHARALWKGRPRAGGLEARPTFPAATVDTSHQKPPRFPSCLKVEAPRDIPCHGPPAVTLPEASSEAGSPAHSGPRTVALPTEPVLPPPLCCGPQELHQPPAGQSHRPLCCGNSETAWPQGHRHPPTPCLSREERPGSTGLSVAERTPAGHTPLFAHGHGAQGDRAAPLPRPPACPQTCRRALQRGCRSTRHSL